MTYRQCSDWLREQIVLNHTKRGYVGTKIGYREEEWRPDFWLEEIIHWESMWCNFNNLRSSDYTGEQNLTWFMKRVQGDCLCSSLASDFTLESWDWFEVLPNTKPNQIPGPDTREARRNWKVSSLQLSQLSTTIKTWEVLGLSTFPSIWLSPRTRKVRTSSCDVRQSLVGSEEEATQMGLYLGLTPFSSLGLRRTWKEGRWRSTVGSWRTSQGTKEFATK